MYRDVIDAVAIAVARIVIVAGVAMAAVIVLCLRYAIQQSPSIIHNESQQVLLDQAIESVVY